MRIPKSLIYSILFFCQLGIAQEAMTFDACLERAMQQNPSIRAALYNERIAVLQHKASFGGYLPVVTADAENRNSWGKEIDSDTNLFVNDVIRNTEGTLNATYNLFSGLTVLHTIRAAKQDKDITRANIEVLRNQVTIELAQRFITILYLQDIIEANRQQISSSEKQLEIAQLKYDQGYIAESELFKIRAQKANEELTLLTNENNLNDNMISLKQLMDMPLDTELLLLKPELNLNEFVAESSDPLEISKKAVEIHPAFRASLLQQKRARTELALMRAERYPQLSLRAMWRTNVNHEIEDEMHYRDQMDGNISRQLRFYITIPIFNQFATHSRIRSSRWLFKQSIVETKVEENRLTKEVLLAINNARTALKKNEASNIAFDFSQRSFDADALKFEMGKISITELNTSKILYNNTQADQIRSRYELLFNNALIRFYMGEAFTL